MELDRIVRECENVKGLARQIEASRKRLVDRIRSTWRRVEVPNVPSTPVASGLDAHTNGVVRRPALSMRGIMAATAVGIALIAAFAWLAQRQEGHVAPKRVVNSDPAAYLDVVRTGDAIDAIARAKTSVDLVAFTLRPDAPVVRALSSASSRKAQVSVMLAGGAGAPSRANGETVRVLQSHGVDDAGLAAFPRRTHIDAAITDDAVYLSARGWSSHSSDAVVIRDGGDGDRALVEKALLGESGSNDRLSTRKADALRAEANLMHAAAGADGVRIATESLGAGNAVYDELARRRRAGEVVMLLLAQAQYRSDPSERAAAAALMRAGVQIRLAPSAERVAIDGDEAWVGSANATADHPEQLDFGIVVKKKAIAEQLREGFDREWKRAAALHP